MENDGGGTFGCRPQGTPSNWLAPSRRTIDFSDFFQWAKTTGVFITQDDLVPRLSAIGTTGASADGRAGVLVLDVRDDDAAGGHVAGALHFPDSTFLDRMDELLALLRQRRPSMIVLHCMESARRGPRCAKRLYDRLASASNGDGTLPPPNAVRVLVGGADQWIRRFWQDNHLVEDFDDQYWGWAGTRDEEHVEAREEDMPQHTLYERPSDQQPWQSWNK